MIAVYFLKQPIRYLAYFYRLFVMYDLTSKAERVLLGPDIIAARGGAN